MPRSATLIVLMLLASPDPGGRVTAYHVTGWFLEVSDNRATVLADSAVVEGASAAG